MNAREVYQPTRKLVQSEQVTPVSTNAVGEIERGGVTQFDHLGSIQRGCATRWKINARKVTKSMEIWTFFSFRGLLPAKANTIQMPSPA